MDLRKNNFKNYVFPLMVLLLQICGCIQNKGYSEQEEINAKKIQFGKAFYDKGKGTPAQFITDQRARYNFEGYIVRGEEKNYAAAVKKLSVLYKEAQEGFNWKVPPLHAEIPYMVNRPVIDGKITSAEALDALCYKGEYILGKVDKMKSESSLWYIGWSNKQLYIAAKFLDSDINISKRIFKGDSLEFFIRPNINQLLYYEFVVNPDNERLCLMHGNNKWGRYITLAKLSKNIIQSQATKNKQGYVIEISVPLESIHGNWCNRDIRAGDSFSFIIVRTNKKNGAYRKSSPVPFLYDGHNIFGYISGRLKK